MANKQMMSEEEWQSWVQRYENNELKPQQEEILRTLSVRMQKQLPVRPNRPAHLEQRPMEWDDVFQMALDNLGPSAMEAVRNTVTAVMHPIETAKGLGKTAVGLTTNALQGIGILEQGEGLYDEQGEAVINFFRDRYGSTEGLKQTIAKDPVGVMLDVASVLSAGGGALGSVSSLGKVGQAARALGKAANMVDPMNIAATGAKYGTTAVFNTLRPNAKFRLYESAVPMPTKMKAEARKNVAKIGMEKGLRPTMYHLDKTRKAMDALDEQIDVIVSNAEMQFREGGNRMLDIDPFLTEGLDAAKRFDDEINPLPYWAGVYEAVDELVEARGGQRVTPADLHKYKRSLNKKLKKAYESQKNITDISQGEKLIGKTAALKTINRRLRQTVEELVPEIGDLNKEFGKYLEIEGHLEKAVNSIYNKALLPSMFSSAGAGWLGHQVAGKWGTIMAIAAKQIIDKPTVKAWLAEQLYKSYRPSTQFGAPVRNLRAAGMISGEANEEVGGY